MQKIVPHLWYDGAAEEAARLYVDLVPRSAVTGLTRYGKAGREIHGQPEGQVMTVDFTLGGTRLVGLNGGPVFRPNASFSLFVTLPEAAQVDRAWAALLEGGEVLMPLDGYDWSPRYGWLSDRWGVSWQIAQGDPAATGRMVAPCLLFAGAAAGQAEAAMAHWIETIPGSKVQGVLRHQTEPGLAYGGFELGGETFIVMDSRDAPFAFNEGASLGLVCADQAELDRRWRALSAVPEAEVCGWLKDRFGVSWQMLPQAASDMLSDPDRARADRVMEAMLAMKKPDIAALEAAYAG